MKITSLMIVLMIALYSFNGMAQAKHRPPKSNVDTSSEGEGSVQKSIAVFDNDVVPQPYIVLGKIHVEASTPKGLSDKIKSKAKKYKADAILNYQVKEAQSISGWTGATIHGGEGIAVRWANQGETGIKRITPDTSIPVLE